MRIAATDIGLQATHQAHSREFRRERLEAWVGERPNNAPRGAAAPRPLVRESGPPVNISPQAQARAAAESAASDEVDDSDLNDPRILFLKQIIEAMTGREIRTLRPSDVQRTDSPTPPPPDSGSRAPRPARDSAGFGLVYEQERHYIEFEKVRFEASGAVRTEDGRTVEFRIELELERLYEEHARSEIRLGDAQLKDPLVLDFAGPASDLADTRFSFDLDADGNPDAVPLLPGGKGFLAFDRNGNGQVDDGSELFGPTSGDGFAELARLDTDANGWVDEADADFSRLGVWTPAADGQGALLDARSAGLGAVYLGAVATPFQIRDAANQTLGVMRSTSIYLREDGSAGTVSQIDLSV